MRHVLNVIFAFGMLPLIFCLVALAAGDEKVWPEKNIDFIVVGAGAAGAAVAARLSENGEHRVLLLEAGKEPLKMSQIPYFGLGPFGGQMDWKYVTERQEKACLQCVDQKLLWPRGKALGGSTAINGMFFTRGNRRDYDTWVAFGNEGWAYDDVLPYFIKMENYNVSLIRESDAAFHGKNGPVHISRPSFSTPLATAFLEAGRELGFSETDINAATHTGFMNPVFTIRNGKRFDTNDAYLKPAKQRPNLHVVTEAFVTKILFDERKKAIGVIFEKEGIQWTVKSKKEVILCAGASNSPHLLLLSGVGPKETLEKFKIPIVHSSPGVGQNLKDHAALTVTFTFDADVAINRDAINPQSMELWETKGEGPLSVPIRSEGVIFFNSHFADPKEDFPDLEIVSAHPPGFNLGLNPKADKAASTPKENLNTYNLFTIVLRPKSTGYLTLGSSNPYDPPLIQPRLLTESQDVEMLLDGVKFGYKLMQTESFKKFDTKPLATKLPGCEAFEQFTDDYFRCQIRHYSMHVFHPSGTCKMGPKTDSMAVVDTRLRVRGVSGLRVVDVSISPTIVSAHTMAPGIMIGEKGAAMILEDWQSRHQEL